MLVTFSTKVSADITMFGDVAVELLKHMGQTGVVPGALLGPDIAPALEQLKQRCRPLATRPSGNAPPSEDDKDEERTPMISMRQRAVPLVQLLGAAARESADVMWREASHHMVG